MPTLEICLTHHAVDRFQERVRPGLSREAAEDELARLVLFGSVVTEPPAWLCTRPGDAYLVIGDLALPLLAHAADGAYYATTCLVRGSRFSRRRRSCVPARTA
jgi:hypothetical protein